ncbi:MAG: winged helix-turn-helix domain-containing protein [Nitrososphaerota archaeon]
MKILKRKVKRRSVDVIANILEIAKDGAIKTRIMQLANLSYMLCWQYLDLLKNKNFLEYNSIERKYKTTDKGIEFLKEYYEFREIEEKFKEIGKRYEEKIKIIEGIFS